MNEGGTCLHKVKSSWREDYIELYTSVATRRICSIKALEKGEYHRSRSMPGSYPYAGRNSAEVCGVEFHGILEREKQPDDLRKIPRAEIQIQESGILVPGILRGHGGDECKEDRRVHPAPAGRRQGRGTADDGKYLSPFTGSK